MTTSPRQPENLNLLQPTKFQLTFSRIPGFVFFLQTVNLPGLSMNEVMQPTPFSDQYYPGEKIQYDTLNCGFLLDEDMRAWLEIHDWMQGLGFPEAFPQYNRLVERNRAHGKTVSDATLTLTTNSNTPSLRVLLKSVFPTMLGSVNFDQTQDGKNTMIGDATFRFSYYTIDRIS